MAFYCTLILVRIWKLAIANFSEQIGAECILCYFARETHKWMEVAYRQDGRHEETNSPPSTGSFTATKIPLSHTITHKSKTVNIQSAPEDWFSISNTFFGNDTRDRSYEMITVFFSFSSAFEDNVSHEKVSMIRCLHTVSLPKYAKCVSIQNSQVESHVGICFNFLPTIKSQTIAVT